MKLSLKDEITSICEEEILDNPVESSASEMDVLETLRGIFSELLKIPPQMLEDDAPLDEYGIDSILNIKIIEKIEEAFGPQRKTLLFEYNTIESLSLNLIKSEKKVNAPVVKEVKKASPKEDVLGDFRENDIAIIGLAGRYPGSRKIDEYWKNLALGKDLITPIPKDRWDNKQYFSRFDESEMPYLKEAGFMDGVYEFDPMFFAIAPNEARDIEPQERLFLECCYEAMEDAGYTRANLSKEPVGVFAGAMNGDYNSYCAQEQVLGNPSTILGHSSSVANRVSYFMNLSGPSFTVDTMCSSSLTALHLACRSLVSGECKAAFVGGVNLNIHPIKFHRLCKGKFMSSHARCMAFGKDADGYVPSEGVGAILIKPLKDAVSDGDHIYGVIKGTAINHGGKTSGYTVPSPEAQSKVIKEALLNAQIEPDRVTYIEAHGTGTKLGDPIEITGLERIYKEKVSKNKSCAIGSVKSNIGHTEGAAGIAGLTKILLQMREGKIAPSLHSSELNPYIDFENSPFFVPQKLMDWERISADGNGKVYPRCAGISSFGAGGSNSHVIIEEYIGKNSAEKPLGTPMAVPVSARTKEQLEAKVAELYAAVKKLSEEDFLSVVYTLQTGREFFDYRIGFMASDMKELREKLLACKEKKEAEGIYSNHVVRSPETVKELSALKEEAGKFLEEGNQNELLKLWTKGADVSFDKLYEGIDVQKISLPTYPFDRTVYCSIDRMKKLLFPEGNEKADEEPYELMTFEERLVPAPVSDSDIAEKEHRILCFAQGADLRQSATEEASICSGKIDIVWVQAGEQYNRFSATDYAINYDHEEDFEKCLFSVMEEDKKIDEIIYLIPMEDNLYFRNYAPLIYLLKSLYAAGLGETKLYIAGAADDELNLAYAKALVGMERSVGVSELSANIAVILTDSINTDKRAFLGTMFKECLLGTTESVIYENGERKCYRVKPFEIEKSNKCRIRKNGTYLITGGMGGLGLIFARHLGQKYNANLILTGRKSESDIQEKLAALKDEGVNAVYVSADVCNEEQIKKAVETAKTKFGALNGVIHAAGLTEGKTITQKDETEFSKITRPKMQGTLLLEKALENVDIDFICYFSSISAVLGDFGSFDYAVGNRFLVSYAEHRRLAKGSLGETIVIEWPFWHDGGMGFATEAAERMYMRTSGQKGLTSQVGTVLFDLLIDSGKDCSFAMYGIPERVSKTLGIGINELKKINLNEVDAEPEKKAATACEVSTASAVKEVTTVSAKTSKEILDKLHGLVGKILGVGMNDIDDNLFLADFGFDSISLSQFAKDITAMLNVKVTPDVFYRYTTLNELTGFISEHVKVTEVKAAEPSDKPQQKDAYVAPLSQDGIVIVGISGKFPDADNVDELWDILVNGVEAIHGAPKRKGWENFKDTDGNVRLGALKTIDEFDPAFFEISPREACFMDPRQRLLLEETYGAMLDAGVSQKEIEEGRIGMFIGAEEGDYGILSSGGSVTANHNGVLAARLSYFLNLHGPNMCINTACSSGLVAFHQACQSLRTGECDIAIAAGVNLMCTPVLYEGMKKAGMLSESGSCYTFDKRADGMVPSEAVAALVLKRRQAAIRDKDHIYAEVLGSEINYDGRTNGITAPSGKAQAQLLEDTYKRFGIDPSRLSYYVAHGTGTRIGDPIELNSAFEAFSKAGVKKNSCIITSTKPNIGHSLAASGLVSLISLLLAMKNEVIPGEINLDEPSDYVDWEESPFVINRKNRPFKDGDNRRIGAVSAFGMSGTNAHVVVGSVKNVRTAQISKTKWLLVFSAKTEKALKELIKASIEDFKKNKKEEDLPGICYTLLNGRVHYDHRLAFAAGSLADAVSKLEKALLGDCDKSIFMDCVEKGFVPKEKTLQISKLLIKQVSDGSEPDKLQGALNMLAQMYSKGIALDGLYDNLDVIKVTLSPYPFEKKSYWVPKSEPEKVEDTKPKAEPEVKADPKPKPKAEPVKSIKPEVKTAVKEDKKETPKTEVVKRNMNNTENLSIETVLKDLSESLAKELFMEEDEISYDRSFLEMGLDSIVGVEWMRHINKTYGLDIESTRIYEYPTLMELANYIISIKNKASEDTSEEKAPVEEPEKVEEQAVGVLRSLSDAAAFEVNEECKGVGTISLKPLTADAAADTPENISQAAEQKTVSAPSKAVEVDVEEIMKDLAESLAKELFMEPGDVDYDQGFMEMGLDSIVGVEWIRYINKKYNLNVESTRLYEYPTIIKLASYIVSLSSGDGGKAPVKEAPKKEEAKASSKDDIDSIMDKIYSGEIDENAMDLF